MLEKDPSLFDELQTFFFKIFIPAFVGVSIKVAMQIKKERFNFSRVVLSFITGVGCAYYLYPFIDHEVTDKYMPLIVGIVAISGERIAEYLIYKFDVDLFLGSILGILLDKFKNKK